MESTSESFMREAIKLSRRGFPAPNPHVGCVIVQNRVIVGRGWHNAAGMPHAEVMALDEAGAMAKGATAFVTLEPCHHQGRTGPCSLALVQAGIKKVEFSVPDPNPKAAGGADWLRCQGVEVVIGTAKNRAMRANEQFLVSHQQGRPFVTLKAAVTLDGFMAREDGTSKWITGPRARREGHRLRVERGAVLVGWKTVTTDDPALTARIAGVVNPPLRVVLDPESNLTGEEAVFAQAGGSVRIQGIENCSPTKVLANLWDRGVRGVLVEGGPRTISYFLRSGEWDTLEIFKGPNHFGSGLSFPWADLQSDKLICTGAKRWGNDVQISYRNQDTIIRL